MTKLYLFDFFNVIFLSQKSQGLINQKLLTQIDQLRDKANTAVLSNSGFMLQVPFIKPVLEKHFDRIFSAQEMNLDKTEPQTYQYIADQFQIKTSEIFFVDDQEKNVLAARKAGCRSKVFTGCLNPNDS